MSTVYLATIIVSLLIQVGLNICDVVNIKRGNFFNKVDTMNLYYLFAEKFGKVNAVLLLSLLRIFICLFESIVPILNIWWCYRDVCMEYESDLKFKELKNNIENNRNLIKMIVNIQEEFKNNKTQENGKNSISKITLEKKDKIINQQSDKNSQEELFELLKKYSSDEFNYEDDYLRAKTENTNQKVLKRK